MSKNAVKLVPNAQGALITAYASNPEFGYIQLQSQDISISPDGWIRDNSRHALLRGKVEQLTAFLNMVGNSGVAPGRIVIREFRESELPENFKARLDKKKSYEEAIAPFIKRAGKDGIPLTVGGERILRFTDLDATGAEPDKFVQHDNISEVAEARATGVMARSAEF